MNNKRQQQLRMRQRNQVSVLASLLDFDNDDADDNAHDENNRRNENKQLNNKSSSKLNSTITSTNQSEIKHGWKQRSKQQEEEQKEIQEKGRKQQQKEEKVQQPKTNVATSRRTLPLATLTSQYKASKEAPYSIDSSSSSSSSSSDFSSASSSKVTTAKSKTTSRKNKGPPKMVVIQRRNSTGSSTSSSTSSRSNNKSKKQKRHNQSPVSSLGSPMASSSSEEESDSSEEEESESEDETSSSSSDDDEVETICVTKTTSNNNNVRVNLFAAKTEKKGKEEEVEEEEDEDEEDDEEDEGDDDEDEDDVKVCGYKRNDVGALYSEENDEDDDEDLSEFDIPDSEEEYEPGLDCDETESDDDDDIDEDYEEDELAIKVSKKQVQNVNHYVGNMPKQPDSKHSGTAKHTTSHHSNSLALEMADTLLVKGLDVGAKFAAKESCFISSKTEIAPITGDAVEPTISPTTESSVVAFEEKTVASQIKDLSKRSIVLDHDDEDTDDEDRDDEDTDDEKDEAIADILSDGDCSVNDCTVDDCTVDDCTVDDCTVADSSVQGCSVHDCSVHDCSVHDCSVHDCSVHDCSVHDCSVHDCSVHDCSVHDCSVKDVTVGLVSGYDEPYEEIHSKAESGELSKIGEHALDSPVPKLHGDRSSVFKRKNDRDSIAEINCDEFVSALFENLSVAPRSDSPHGIQPNSLTSNFEHGEAHVSHVMQSESQYLFSQKKNAPSEESYNECSKDHIHLSTQGLVTTKNEDVSKDSESAVALNRGEKFSAPESVPQPCTIQEEVISSKAREVLGSSAKELLVPPIGAMPHTRTSEALDKSKVFASDNSIKIDQLREPSMASRETEAKGTSDITSNSGGETHSIRSVFAQSKSQPTSDVFPSKLKDKVFPSVPEESSTGERVECKQDSSNESSAPARSRAREMIKRGCWTLGAKIGSGAFGVVHIGMNTQTGTLMAVKSIQVETGDMKDVRREIQLLKSFQHRNIVRYLGAELTKTHLHIFQEWVAGGSVAGMLSKFGPFSVSVVRSYVSQLLDGLIYLHQNTIVHRDIKGSNLLVSDDGVLKLADFGASKRLKGDYVLKNTMVGTPYFMAPEVFEENYSFAADIWSVGCAAFQMVTGSPPWKNLKLSNPIALFRHVTQHDGPPHIDPSRLSGYAELELTRLKAFLVKCFKKDPSDRPSASQLRDDAFFIETHCWSVGDQSPLDFLFSPGSKSSFEDLRSPPLPSPRPRIPGRCNSTSLTPSSALLSPPVPKMQDAISHASPPANKSDWPTWARKYDSTLQVPKPSVEYPRNSVGSLSYSGSSAPGSRMGDKNGGTGNLNGLNFLDSSDEKKV